MKNVIFIFFVLVILSKSLTAQHRVFETCTNWCGWFPQIAGTITNTAEPDDHVGIIYFQGDAVTGYTCPATIGKIDSTGTFSWAKVLGDSIPSIFISNVNDTTITYKSNYSEMIHIASGGYCLAGVVKIETTVKDSTGATIYSANSGLNIITRVDSAGNVIWCKSYGNNFSNEGIVYNAISGKYCIFGKSVPNLLIIDSMGNVDWLGEISGGNNITSGIFTKDGNFILTAINSGNAEIIKLDTSGNVLFADSFTNTGNPTNLKAIELNHNIVLLCNNSIWMADSNGQMVWSKNLVADSTIYAYDLVKFNDNYFSIIVGKYESQSMTVRYYFINVDSLGNILNHCFTTYGVSSSSGTDYFNINYHSCERNSVGFALLQSIHGYLQPFGIFSDNKITQTDSLGCSCYTDTVIFSPSLVPSLIVSNPISITPVVLSHSSANYLLKSTPVTLMYYQFCLGYVSVNELNGNSKDNFTIVPNPSGDEICIYRNALNGKKYSQLIIRDMNGKVCFNRPFVDNEPILISHFKNGVYIVQLIEDNKIYAQKLVVIH